MAAADAAGNLTFRLARLDDFPALSDLEAASFPADEAGSRENMERRCREANPYFIVANDSTTGSLVGFVNGTLIATSEIEHESMSEHRPEGRGLVIHSVTVDTSLRRKGIGSKLLTHYIDHVRRLPGKPVDAILLLSKLYLIGFYESNGFKLAKRSSKCER